MAEKMGVIITEAFQCERCGHIWISKIYTKENLPVTCAKCKSPYWNRPAKVKGKGSSKK